MQSQGNNLRPGYRSRQPLPLITDFYLVIIRLNSYALNIIGLCYSIHIIFNRGNFHHKTVAYTIVVIDINL